MSAWHRLALFLVMVAIVCPGKQASGQEPQKKADGQAVAMRFTAFEQKEPFYQRLETSTTQKMTVMGQLVDQTQEQTFFVKWTPLAKKDGNFRVKQQIIGIKMQIDIGGVKIAYDSTDPNPPKNPMTEFFQTLIKKELTFTISPKMEVVAIDGATELVKSLAVSNTQMEPLLKSIMSDDALKNMAAPTWSAMPLTPVRPGQAWKAVSVLDLGPVGTYTSTATHTLKGVKDDKATIITEAALTYQAPKEKAGLPFTIKKAELSSKSGSGEAIFNLKKGRFDSSSLTMNLAGNLIIEVGGMATEVSLEQKQIAKVATFDTDPLDASEKGK